MAQLTNPIRRLFLDHPASVEETYTEHFGAAMKYSVRLAGASMAAAIHALVPGLCCTTASQKINDLHDEMSARRALAEANSADAA